jgi:Uma2 family endonuclease
MATQPRRLRADDVPDIPITDPSIVGYELIDGELVPVMGARVSHGWWIIKMGARLDEFVRAHAAGSVLADVWWRVQLPRDPERLHAPDVAFVAAGRLPPGAGNDVLRVPPDLIVEIYSATNNRKPGDFQRRIRDYLDGGARLLWVIYPEARYAMVHRPDGSARMAREHEELDGEDVLPGLRIELGELFREMP